MLHIYQVFLHNSQTLQVHYYFIFLCADIPKAMQENFLQKI